jgi:hypothetical protein
MHRHRVSFLPRSHILEQNGIANPASMQRRMCMNIATPVRHGQYVTDMKYHTPQPPQASRFKPLFDRVMVQRAAAATKSAGGIMLPESVLPKVNEATVVAVGPGKYSTAGTIIPMVSLSPRCLYFEDPPARFVASRRWFALTAGVETVSTVAHTVTCRASWSHHSWTRPLCTLFLHHAPVRQY